MKNFPLMCVIFLLTSNVGAWITPAGGSLRPHLSLFAGKGFGAPKTKKVSEEEQMIQDIRATLLERPKEEPLHFNLGLLLLSSSPTPSEATKREAMLAFENAVMLNPNREGSWYNLAVLREELSTNEGALEAYEKTLDLSKQEQLRIACFANKISILTNMGDLESAAKCSEEAVKEFPNESSLWCGMGVVLRMDRNVEWSIKAFENALACCEKGRGNKDENALVAYNNLGALYASSIAMKAGSEGKEAGVAAAGLAVGMYEKALMIAPKDLSSLYGLGMLQRDLGQIITARSLFERALAVAPEDQQIPYQLAMLDMAEGKPTATAVESAPREYVSSLFDYYASNDYDEHILSLDYAGPELLWRAFERAHGRVPVNAAGTSLVDARVVELGCGSGLVGKYFRSRGFGYSFEGCDLSSVMAKQATDAIFDRPDSPGNIDMVYSKVECADAESYLRAKQVGSADLILAGDVLCYLGKLDSLFAAALPALRPGTGLFLFTTECLTPAELSVDGTSMQGFALRSSGRFAHSREYVENLAEKHGFRVEACESVESLRREGAEKVSGLVVTLRKK
jgi:predicted TPR repeat methyltransferase